MKQDLGYLLIIIGFSIIVAILIIEVILPKRDICGIAQKRLRETHLDWSHNGFNKGFHKYCLFCYQFGENLARGQKDIKDVYEQWEASPEHKENLDTKWKDRCFVWDIYEGVNYYVEIYAN